MTPIARRRSDALRATLAALLLTACQHSMTASLGAGAAPRTTTTSTSPAEQTAPNTADPDFGPTGDTAELVGSTPDEATRRARARGYRGKIEVFTAREFVAGCTPGTVCGVIPRLYEMAHSGSLKLYINRELTITTPN